MARRKHSVGFIVLSLVFGVGLWGYVSLSGEYEADITVLLTVEPPPNQALLSTVPNELTVRVRTTGLQLVNLKYLSTTPVCEIDLEDHRASSDAMYTIERDDFIRALTLPGAVKIQSVQPTTLSMATGDVFTKEVPVDLRSNVSCRDGFMVVGIPTVEPSVVEIQGTKSVVESIESWPTRRLALEDLYEPSTSEVEMSDSLMMLLRVEPNRVKVSLDVQQIAEVDVYDVIVQSADDDPSVRFKPQQVTVTIRGGTDVVARVLRSDITAVVPPGSKGPVQPIFHGPPGVLVISSTPTYVEATTESP